MSKSQSEQNKNQAKTGDNKTNLERQLEQDNNKEAAQTPGEESNGNEDTLNFDENNDGQEQNESPSTSQDKPAAGKAKAEKAGAKTPVKEKLPDEDPTMVKLMLKMMDRMDQLEQQVRDNGAEKKSRGEEVLDDYMDTPTVYFSFRYTYSLFPDLRMGKLVPPPGDRNHVLFERLYRFESSKGTRGESQTTTICQYVCHSKGVDKWLREHSLFNISFFEKLTEAMMADTTLQDKLISASNMVSRYTEHQIIEAAKLRNIPMTTDIAKLKKQLISSIAEEFKTQERNIHENRMQKLMNKQKLEGAGGREFELTKLGADQ